MLGIHYGGDVPQTLRDLVEFHGRALGLALADLERAGRDLATAESFILAAERGDAGRFLDALDARIAPAPLVALALA